MSTLANESYAYDDAGRLLETQETPAGKGCVVRQYVYEEESNRTSETTRAPGTEGKCATEGGTVERHTYDEANRLTDTGVEYETFDNTTKMPANDADGHELVSAYYVDNQVFSQEQNKQLVDYTYDPLGRTIETTSENKETKTKSTKIFHYAGAGGALTWTSEGTENWTRNIPGIDGALDAIQTSSGTITLQLHDLQGDIVGTAEDNETATKLLSTYNSTEFGVPSEGKTPPKYAWLGAGGVSTETSFESGIVTQNGASYVPQVARALQTAPVVPPGAFPNGQGTGSQDTSEILGWYISLSSAESTATGAEYQKKLEEEARKRAEEAAAIAQRIHEEEENLSSSESGAEEEGDPCETIEASGSASLLGANVMETWAKIKWCWTNGSVVSAYGASKGELTINHWDLPLSFRFLRWEEIAYWKGADYIVERDAVFGEKRCSVASIKTVQARLFARGKAIRSN